MWVAIIGGALVGGGVAFGAWYVIQDKVGSCVSSHFVQPAFPGGDVVGDAEIEVFEQQQRENLGKAAETCAKEHPMLTVFASQGLPLVSAGLLVGGLVGYAVLRK